MAFTPHQPVLYHEIIHALQPKSPGHFLDGTVGAGGHARGILEACAPDGRLLGLDLDPQALALASEYLAPYGERVRLVQASFVSLLEVMETTGWKTLQGLLLDLGASSMQFDTAERGFSFQSEGPLDMRFDPSNPLRAADLVNDLPEDELADILFHFGEERRSRHIAQAIVQARPVTTTRQLAEVVTKVYRSTRSAAGSQQRRHIHPATRTFQALRIAVNDELRALKETLPKTVSALAPGGRLAVIAFHSLEDRLTKEFIRRESKDCICPPGQPVCTCEHKATLKVINRKPIRPGDNEIKANPRARSARLRVVERL